VLVVPTVDTAEEAQEIVNWAYFPPFGKRSQGGGFAFDPNMWGGVPGGYRATINDNLVVVVMLETLEALKNADAIAKVPGITAVFAASGDLGNFSGYKMGDPDYERSSTSCTTLRSSGARNSAGPSRGRTGRIFPASRRATSLRRSRAALAPSSASSTTRKESPTSDPSRPSDGVGYAC